MPFHRWPGWRTWLDLSTPLHPLYDDITKWLSWQHPEVQKKVIVLDSLDAIRSDSDLAFGSRMRQMF